MELSKIKLLKDRELYRENIPECCSLKTYEEHRGILSFCWNLLISYEENKKINCDKCEFKNIMPSLREK